MGRSFYLRGDRREWFSLIVPEGSLRDGPNRVELLQVLSGGRLLRLARSAGPSAPGTEDRTASEP